MLQKAINIILENQLASTSLLQRRMQLSYRRASEFMDNLCELGIVSESKGAKPRDILITDPGECSNLIANNVSYELRCLVKNKQR